MKLKDKSVVVTGAVAGMGHAITELFANEGANIIAVDVQGERLLEFAEELQSAPGKVIPFIGDVADVATDEKMIDLAVENFGRLDILVNNAGVMDDNTAVGDVSDEMLINVIKVNTCGPIYAMRKAVRVFLEQDDEQGCIINITSVGASHQTSGLAYCASKAALASATRNTAFMYLDKGIRCNAIAPGGVLTEIPLTMPPSDPFGFDRTSSLLTHAPEMGMPEDIANAALFLASDESHFINGMTLTADGGWTTF